VSFNCANIQPGLAEARLFGTVRGAFSEARDTAGLFLQAEGGVLFLDEIAELDAQVQAKLLRVIETGTFRRLGGTSEISVDVRVVAATNRQLPEMVTQGHFREDLYYRLNTIRIEVPPLRERPDDVACLAAHFVARFNRRFAQHKNLSPEAVEALVRYSWPGNVRQLINVIEQVVVLVDEDTLTPMHLPSVVRPHGVSGSPRTHGSAIVPLKDVERQYVEFVIKQFDGHRAHAARALGIGERSLYRKLNEYGLD
jgi:transcriptional regulator with PAS, ATPase and Fis domain